MGLRTMELSWYLRAVPALPFWYGLGVVCTGEMHSMWKNNVGGNIFSGNRSRGSHLLSSCSMLVSLNALCFN